MLSVIANQPIDVPTRETLMFLTSRIPLGAEILEVGCGEGHVAGELLKHGYRVTALDSDPEVIARAQARGVPAMVGSWPEFDGSASFDTIVFTRSLHHITPLREAIGHARELLKPMGSLLIEDFAFEDVKESTIGWFAKVVRAKQAMALITPIADQLVTDLLSSTDVMDAWQRNRGHDLHSMAVMNEAIAERFVVDETWSVPYLYRYLIPVLAETSKAAAFVNEVFEQEALLGQRSRGVLLGRRVVASPRSGEMQTLA
jgi:2-polyprenyl-3-methyl-5-hydroxy-6-metoxy-1,4-benzoquinol methylase